MADGVTMKVRGLEKSLARLRRISPNVDRELDKAQQKSAHEFVAVASQLAPVGMTGDYAASINAKPVSGELAAETRSFSLGVVKAGTQIGSAWGIFADWIWHFVEFGTVKTVARPHMLPAQRLLKKRILGRMRRAVNKAIRDALK